MALRDQPYFPFYVQDYLTDEKLSCCSLSSQGVLTRILCIFHKSENYGGILFKQIPKQNFSSIEYFVFIISKQIGCSISDVTLALEELLFFKVLKIEKLDGVDFLMQKRMVKDNDISMKRSESAKKGGGNPNLVNTKNKLHAKNLFKQIHKQNTEDEYVYENEDENIKKKVDKKFNFKNSLIEAGFNSDLVNEWCSIREKKKAVNSEKAFKDFLTEVEKTGIEKNVILEYITDGSRQWKGFKATWYLKDQPQSNIKPNTEPTRNFDLS